MMRRFAVEQRIPVETFSSSWYSLAGESKSDSVSGEEVLSVEYVNCPFILVPLVRVFLSLHPMRISDPGRDQKLKYGCRRSSLYVPLLRSWRRKSPCSPLMGDEYVSLSDEVLWLSSWSLYLNDSCSSPSLAFYLLVLLPGSFIASLHLLCLLLRVGPVNYPGGRTVVVDCSSEGVARCPPPSS